MQKRYSIRTLDDARAVVRDYGFDLMDWEGVGTAEGFANKLYFNGAELHLADVAEALNDYRRECESDNTDEVDARYAEKRHYFEGILNTHAQKRNAAAETIRKLKFEAPGAVYWNMVAKLATTDDRAFVIEELAADECRLVLEALDGFEALAAHFWDSDSFPYRPGKDVMLDHCIECDIRRLDVRLETAEPWDGKDADWSYEAAALLHLLNRTPVRAELAARIGAEEAESLEVS